MSLQSGTNCSIDFDIATINNSETYPDKINGNFHKIGLSVVKSLNLINKS